MNRFLSIILLGSLMFTSSCSGKLSACNDRMIVIRAQNAEIIPRAAFSYIELESFYYPSGCSGAKCGVENKSRYASGVFVIRSESTPGVAYVLTVRHLCVEAPEDAPHGMRNIHNTYSVTDYHGKKHDARFYFSSSTSDTCILSVSDVTDDQVYAEIALGMPNIGSVVFNVAAPRAYFNPNAALIFQGIYSGEVGAQTLVTIPTNPGSSGSPVFDSDGHLIGIIIGIPIMKQNDDPTMELDMRVIESLALVESLDAVHEIVDTVTAIDRSLKTKTSTSAKKL